MEKSGGAFFLSWPESFHAGVEAAGGKGWNLGRLKRYGFNVPAGGVLVADAYRDFIEENNLLEDMGKITRIITTGNIGDKEIEQKLILLREKIKAGLIPASVRDDLKDKLRATIDSFTRGLLKENFEGLTEKDLLNKFNEIKSVFIEYCPVFLSCSFSYNEKPLEKLLEKYFSGKGKAMANTLMSGGGGITSAEQGYRLVELAEIARGDDSARRFFFGENYNPLSWEKELPEESPFKQSFRSFLAEYGHRGVYEMDMINPRWREDPSYTLNVVRSTMETADLGKIKVQQKEKADEVWREINQRVPFYRRSSINRLIRQTVKGIGTREMSKSVLVKISGLMRLVFRGMGIRLAGRGILADPVDIYHCACSEIFSILQGYWDGRGLDILVAERKARRKEMEALSPPDVIIDETPQFAEPAARGAGNALSGIGVASGRASGAAKIIYHPDEGEKLRAGDVLVAPSTDPGWTPLFLRASAIVMETGGLLSHGSIVAREYGIPAVVNIPGVMKMIKDSQLITVDGGEGKVYL